LSDASSETSDKPVVKMRKNKSKASTHELSINTE